MAAVAMPFGRKAGPADEKKDEGPLPHGFQYDLVVIGGGSGGLACSKEAGKLGKKVALLDFVDPSPQGTKWGLGGTCVNVGCIPKKLMHQASLLGEGFSDARSFGWGLAADANKTLDWGTMVGNVQMYIKSLNFGYRVATREAGVEYINAKGKFKDAHTIIATKPDGTETELTADKIVIAVGGRPRYLGVPGDKELCITSDDIFSMKKAPGKTLVVGASYIALECAGFLNAAGFETHVMARSIFLRGFDQQIAEHIAKYMESHGIAMIRPCTPSKFEKTEEGRIKVTYTSNDFPDMPMENEYDTVLLAVGRYAITEALDLPAAGLEANPKTGKFDAPHEVTNVPHIFAIGDVLETRQELTPVAIKAGVRLARRLFAGATLGMDYNEVPTTVFTPLEYSCCGLSEEDADAKFGADNIEVYHSYLKPLEWALNHETTSKGGAMRGDNDCYVKMITHLKDDERIVGLHYVGPNAGEIMQGFAVGMKMGATKAVFDDVVGIHPTMAEEFTTVHVTKRSGGNAMKSGC